MNSEAARLSAWRRAHGLTQAGAAHLCGVDANTWYRWESGRAAAPPAALRLLLVLDELWRTQPAWWRAGPAALRGESPRGG